MVHVHQIARTRPGMGLTVGGGELCQTGRRRLQDDPPEDDDAKDSGDEAGESEAVEGGQSWVTRREVLKYSRTWVRIIPWGLASDRETVQA